MIPKKIHYCWFGRNPLPESAIKCINSWRKFFPEYEILEWNEDNFDVNSIKYTQDAYAAAKYAFVSDYARFKVINEHGGIYFDTDIEIIKPFDDILSAGAFMGVEIDGKDSTGIYPIINPGLGFAAEPNLPIITKIVQAYDKLPFLNEEGEISKFTMIPLVSGMLRESGLKTTDTIQRIAGLTIYPSEFFNPLDDATGILNITDNTHSIHWFTASWLPAQPKWKKKAKQLIRRILRKI